jgi:hypothetical protein
MSNVLSKVFVFFQVVAFSTSVLAQQFKAKEVKKFLEGGVSEISIVTNDTFTPERNQEMDLKVTFTNGKSVFASEYHFIWDQVTCKVDNAGWKIKGELLSNGKGLIVPYTLSKYYSSSEVVIRMNLQDKTTSKKVSATYCIENCTLVQKGNDGGDGSSGSEGSSSGGSGRSGSDGSNGDAGPDIEVIVDEELVDSKPYMVLSIADQKYKLDPACSSVTIISRGGEGGKGGSGGRGGTSLKDNKNEYKNNGGRGGSGARGGRGGMGGTITVSGSAVEKYKSRLTFISEGGQGGDGGRGGYGGRGKSNGTSGMDGSNGSRGSAGQVIFK